MGVHLAQFSVSGLRYPMGATIGCGLQGAQAFSSAKKRTNGSKNTTATFCNVSHGADSCPARVQQQ